MSSNTGKRWRGQMPFRMSGRIRAESLEHQGRGGEPSLALMRWWLDVLRANAIAHGGLDSEKVAAATQESQALQQRSDNAARTARGHSA